MSEQWLKFKKNDMSYYYPIIRYPLSIRNVIENPLIEPNAIPLPKFDFPTKRSFQVKDLPLIIISPIVSFLMIAGGLKNEIYFISVIGTIILLITIREIGQLINSEEIYKQKLNEYNSLFAPYHKRQKEISEYRINSSKSDWIFNKKKEKISFLFKHSNFPKHLIKNIKVGKSENLFYSILVSKFGDKIIRNYAIDLFESGKAFIPDIIYADIENRIFIDIEIDEPYSFENKEPIHYLKNSIHIDEERDKYFLENYWLVIRFSEKQIINNIIECVNTIELIISSIENQYIVDKSILLKNGIQTQSCWSYSDAKKMALENYRN